MCYVSLVDLSVLVLVFHCTDTHICMFPVALVLSVVHNKFLYEQQIWVFFSISSTGQVHRFYCFDLLTRFIGFIRRGSVERPGEVIQESV